MAPSTMIILEGALAFGVPLLLAAHELIALRRPSGGPGGHDGGPRDEASAGTPPPGSEPQAPSALPACLIAAVRGDASGIAAGQAGTKPVLETV